VAHLDAEYAPRQIAIQPGMVKGFLITTELTRNLRFLQFVNERKTT
jgi:hypothetical protein